MDARDQTVSVAVSKIPRIDTPLHSASKLTTGQTSGDKPKSPKIVGDNVSDKANPCAIVENSIQGGSVTSTNKDRETDSEVAKAQTGLAGINESRMEYQTKPTTKLKTSGKSLSKKKKRNKTKNKTKANCIHKNRRGISEEGRGSLASKFENKNMNLNMVHGPNCVILLKKRLFVCY